MISGEVPGIRGDAARGAFRSKHRRPGAPFSRWCWVGRLFTGHADYTYPTGGVRISTWQRARAAEGTDTVPRGTRAVHPAAKHGERDRCDCCRRRSVGCHSKHRAIRRRMLNRTGTGWRPRWTRHLHGRPVDESRLPILNGFAGFSTAASTTMLTAAGRRPLVGECDSLARSLAASHRSATGATTDCTKHRPRPYWRHHRGPRRRRSSTSDDLAPPPGIDRVAKRSWWTCCREASTRCTWRRAAHAWSRGERMRLHLLGRYATCSGALTSAREESA